MFKSKHSFLSASSSAWLRYDTQRLLLRFDNFLKKHRATELHEAAQKIINSGFVIGGDESIFNRYVNDAITLGLKPERTLYYSEYAFSTPDACGVTNKTLFIFDLKTGAYKMEQLEIYAAYYILVHFIDQFLGSSVNDNIFMIFSEIEEIVLRIYSLDDGIVEKIISVSEDSEDFKKIIDIVNTIITFDKILSSRKETEWRTI